MKINGYCVYESPITYLYSINTEITSNKPTTTLANKANEIEQFTPSTAAPTTAAPPEISSTEIESLLSSTPLEQIPAKYIGDWVSEIYQYKTKIKINKISTCDISNLHTCRCGFHILVDGKKNTLLIDNNIKRTIDGFVDDDEIDRSNFVFNVKEFTYNGESCIAILEMPEQNTTSSVGEDNNLHEITLLCVKGNICKVYNFNKEGILSQEVRNLVKTDEISCSDNTSDIYPLNNGECATRITTNETTGEPGDFIIPTEITHIPYMAFSYCTSLVSVVIPDHITSIDDYAFLMCTNLVSVVIPDSVTSIGDLAFAGCNFTSVVIPNSVTSIGDRAFWACRSLKSVEIGNSVTSIGDNAFLMCTNLVSVVIPDSVVSIGNDAFLGCGCPENKYVAGTTMCNCDNEDNLCFSELSTTAGSTTAAPTTAGSTTAGSTTATAASNVVDCSMCSTCASTTGYEGHVRIPDGVTHINMAFYECSKLISVVIPDSVTSIGNFAFSWSSSLVSVDIGSGVTSIGDYAFYQCNLTSVVIPDSVTSIGKGAFGYCSSLASVEIGSGVTDIGEAAFQGCISLKSVVIPDSVTDIGDNAFAYCSSLTDIVIPDSVVIIGNDAFLGCGCNKNLYKHGTTMCNCDNKDNSCFPTAAPTTAAPTTAAPTTAAPTTAGSTTAAPTTADPTTADPTTGMSGGAIALLAIAAIAVLAVVIVLRWRKGKSVKLNQTESKI